VTDIHRLLLLRLLLLLLLLRLRLSFRLSLLKFFTPFLCRRRRGASQPSCDTGDLFPRFRCRGGKHSLEMREEAPQCE